MQPRAASASIQDREQARRRWRAAASFADLCALSAEFVAGRLSHFPGWGAGDTDVETDAIAADLAALNRAGFLTVASQPAFAGEVAGRRVEQRAFVAGFARAPLAARLLHAAPLGARRDPIRVLAPAPCDEGGEPEPLTLVDGVARVFAGHAAQAEELELFRGAIGARAHDELAAASWIVAFDPVFGRERALWDELARRLCARG